jgi:hypothetical protein
VSCPREAARRPDFPPISTPELNHFFWRVDAGSEVHTSVKRDVKGDKRDLLEINETYIEAKET